MSTTFQNCCFTGGEECRHGPPETIVYVSSQAAMSSREQHARACAAYAEARAWRVVSTVVETTPTAPLAQREGWRQVTAALEDASALQVVTWHPQQVGAEDVTEFRLMQSEFRDSGRVLVAVTGVPTPHGP